VRELPKQSPLNYINMESTSVHADAIICNIYVRKMRITLLDIRVRILCHFFTIRIRKVIAVIILSPQISNRPILNVFKNNFN
jgi:hypothetical protein